MTLGSLFDGTIKNVTDALGIVDYEGIFKNLIN